MNINLIVLGALFILILFGVGESVYKSFGLSKLFLLICLGLLIAGLYVPNLNIKGTAVSISGFLLPALLCLILAFKVRSATVFVNILIASFVCLLLRLVFVEFDFLPTEMTLILMSVLGFVLAMFAKDGFGLIVSSVVGFVLGNVIFEFIKFGNIDILLQNQISVSYILACVVLGLICLFLKKKVQGMFEKKIA